VVVTAVSVIVFTPVDDTEAEGVKEATNDSDALDVNDSRLEYVTPIDALGEPDIENVIVVLDRAVSVAVLTPDCDTDAVEVIDVSGDKEELGEPDIVNVIVVVVTAVSVAVLTTVEDTDGVGDVEATEDSDANVDGDSRLV
jgi:hypothetical protein